MFHPSISPPLMTSRAVHRYTASFLLLASAEVLLSKHLIQSIMLCGTFPARPPPEVQVDPTIGVSDSGLKGIWHQLIAPASPGPVAFIRSPCRSEVGIDKFIPGYLFSYICRTSASSRMVMLARSCRMNWPLTAEQQVDARSTFEGTQAANSTERIPGGSPGRRGDTQVTFAESGTNPPPLLDAFWTCMLLCSGEERLRSKSSRSLYSATPR